MKSRRVLLAFVTTALIASAQTKAAPKAAPPKPGLTSCAGKIEGRYAETSSGQLQIEFRSGKATLRALGDADVTDCWMAGKKIYLYMPGESAPMELDLNDDGSIQTPLGEFKKKAN